MTFEFKPERIPKIFDQRIADEIYDLFPEFPENLRNFFAATASCSPFLFSQIQNERDWLVDVIKEKEFDLLSLLHPLKSEAYDALYFKLRLAKRRAALWIAICDLADIWSLETVTQKLSEFADLSTDELVGGYDEVKGKKVRLQGYLEEFSLTREEADQLIMSARNIVFK